MGNNCMKNFARYVLVSSFFVIFMQGCAVNKDLVPTGGSRSDGTVKLSYEYGEFESPKLNAQQGADAAAKRCAVWGYSGAQPFGGATKTCSYFSGFACHRWLVTIEYQCTGAPSHAIGN